MDLQHFDLVINLRMENLSTGDEGRKGVSPAFRTGPAWLTRARCGSFKIALACQSSSVFHQHCTTTVSLQAQLSLEAHGSKHTQPGKQFHQR